MHERATRLDWLGLLLAVDSGTHAAHPAVSYVKAEELVVVPGRVAEKGKKGGRAGKAAAGCVSADGEGIARASGKAARGVVPPYMLLEAASRLACVMIRLCNRLWLQKSQHVSHKISVRALNDACVCGWGGDQGRGSRPRAHTTKG